MARKNTTIEQPTGPKIEVPNFYPHKSDAKQLLFELYHQLGTQKYTEDDLSPYQSQILSDIGESVGQPRTRGFDTLLDPRSVDVGALDHGGYNLRKPQISLRCHLTTKHNLSVTWQPYQLGINFEKLPAPEWLSTPLGYGDFVRPDDELMFIRDFGWLRNLDRGHRRNSISVDMYLLTTAIAAWNDLKAFVGWHFEAQVIEEPIVRVRDRREYGFKSELSPFGGTNDVAVGFEIQNTIEAERERLAALTANFSTRYAIPLDTFWDTIQQHRYEHGGLHSQKASRALRKLEATNLTPGAVEKVEQDLLKAIEACVWNPTSNVVALRQTNQR